MNFIPDVVDVVLVVSFSISLAIFVFAVVIIDTVFVFIFLVAFFVATVAFFVVDVVIVDPELVFYVLVAFFVVFVAFFVVDVTGLIVTVAGIAEFVVLVGDHIIFFDTVAVGDVVFPLAWSALACCTPCSRGGRCRRHFVVSLLALGILIIVNGAAADVKICDYLS